jgi:hypothetical protein
MIGLLASRPIGPYSQRRTELQELAEWGALGDCHKLRPHSADDPPGQHIPFELQGAALL